MSLYKIDKNTNIDTVLYKSVGIHENMKPVEIKYEQLENGNEFLAFYFEDKDGVKLTSTEWPIPTNKPLNTMSEEEKEKYLKRIGYQMKKLQYIAEALIGREFTEDDKIEGNSFKELAENFIKFVGDYKNKSVRIKAAYDRNGWITVASSPFNRFIESMEIPKAESKVEMKDYDLTERPKKDSENKSKNPFEEGEVPTTKVEDEIPF